jgi:hypothetical protein
MQSQPEALTSVKVADGTSAGAEITLAPPTTDAVPTALRPPSETTAATLQLPTLAELLALALLSAMIV